jgi:RNA polymerase sigma-70 factor, ECF subfamily
VRRDRQARVSEQNLQTLYARHRQALFTLALSRTGCRERAEDAVHDAFVRICRCDLTRVADAEAYVFAAVRNAAIDQVRRAHAAAPLDRTVADSIFEDRGADPEAGVLQSEQERLIASAVEALPDEQREAIVLRVYGGLSFAQIAQVTGDPLPTVATRFRRGLERLRHKLERFV